MMERNGIRNVCHAMSVIPGRLPGATASLVTVDSVNFLSKEKVFSVSGAKCILCLNSLLVTCNIMFFYAECTSVDRVDLLLSWLCDN